MFYPVITKNKYLYYNGFWGTVETEEDNSLYGKVLFIRDLVLYQGNNLTELEQDFQESVDIYLTHCKVIKTHYHRIYSDNDDT